MIKYLIEEAPKRLALDFSELLKESGGFVAGGVLRNYFEEVYHNTVHSADSALTSTTDNNEYGVISSFGYVSKDVDLFFPDNKTFQTFVDMYYDENDYFDESYSTANSTGFMYITPVGGIKVDCIRKNFGTPEQIISKFDFTTTQAALFIGNDSNGLDKNTVYLMIHPDFKEHIKNRTMFFIEGSGPRQNIMERIDRYWNYGYIPSETNSIAIIDSFLKKYPELSNFTVNDFIESFSNEKNVFSSGVLKSMKKEKNGKRKRMRSKLSKIHSARNSLINLLTMDDRDFNKEPESLSNHTSQERNYVRLAKGVLTSPVNFVNDKDKIYRKTVKDLGLPSNLNFRHYISNDIVAFHQFLIKNKDNIDKEQTYRIIDFVHSQTISNVNNTRLFYCVACDEHSVKQSLSVFNVTDEAEVEKTNDEKIYDHMSSYKLAYTSSDDWLELIQKALDKNPEDVKWVVKTIDFFNNFADDETPIPSLNDFHEALDNDVFDPFVPSSMMMNIISSESN